jgi:hypothetical protein
MNSPTVMFMLLALLPAVLSAQPDPVKDLSCFDVLELPTPGFFAAGAPASGTVEVRAYIGAGGAISKLELAGESVALKAEVNVAMQLSHFAPRCSGRTISVVFAFTLEDPPSDSIIPPIARFRPPNRFELTFRRVKPNIDPGSPPPPPPK